jgi:hypothetical protein
MALQVPNIIYAFAIFGLDRSSGKAQQQQVN